MVSPVAIPNGSGVTHQTLTLRLSHPAATVSAAALATSHFILNVATPSTPPVLHVQIRGHARLSAAHDYTSLGDTWFCVAQSAQSCTCPFGSRGTVTVGDSLENSADLELTGDPVVGTAGVVTLTTLGHVCVTQYKVPSPVRDRR
jgi:hypothetical protein